ncbi:hypothetical protein [Pseudomonas sp. 5P_3.1_Bac2]|uniref:hypothetical protein n=1 Tax=Pseudomonas sp. 5P_3.1_Bac2 TaxID=2971617 RepID=UPI0021C84F81|nr:hypothetical protein [Pseudomonas sp. 5P_3.1_Bac2]MCU1717349.1 hypothetical protein [Pseudomonas sp. 5P_3.1_Bac2]
MSAATDLVVLPPKETALQVFQAVNGLDPFLAQIRKEIDDFVPDVSTRKGREAIASIAHKVARSKTALDNVGKDLVAELKEIPKKIDAERKRVRDLLDNWKDEVRKPLDDWQAAEDARIDRHQAVIDGIKERGAEAGAYDAEYLRGSIAALEQTPVNEDLEEFEAEAAREKDKALSALRDALLAREKQDAERAELERLRRLQAERDQQEERDRIAREAAEKATRDAEARAQSERDAAAQRERDLELEAERARNAELEATRRAEQAERDATARAEQAAADERKRQADLIADEELQAKRREADIEHRKRINNAALAAFIAGGMPEECAKQAITLIVKRQIPNIQITY